jgi:hypothetical protein
MGVRSMTVRRFEEIRRRLGEDRGLREIARALGCSRDTVREVRDGVRNSPDVPKALPDPLWMLQIDWPPLIHDLGLGHPLKFLWEENRFVRSVDRTLVGCRVHVLPRTVFNFELIPAMAGYI